MPISRYLPVCSRRSGKDIADRINDMPSLTTEEKSRYKSALDDLRHKAKTEDADADSTTDGGNDKIYELQIQDDKWLFKQK